MNIFYYKKAKLDIPGYWKFFAKLMLPVVAISIISYYVVDIINPQRWIELALPIAIYVIVYGVIVFVVMNKEERCGLKLIIDRARKVLRRRKR